jgi:hypothetical protein
VWGVGKNVWENVGGSGGKVAGYSECRQTTNISQISRYQLYAF